LANYNLEVEISPTRTSFASATKGANRRRGWIAMKLLLSNFSEKLGLDNLPRVRKTIVAIIGGSVLLFGIILIFLPAPSFLVIPAGLAILATEFVWARRWLQRVRNLIERTRNRFKTGKSAAPQNNSPSSPPASTK
jgi:tellurite resistance protein TerC